MRTGLVEIDRLDELRLVYHSNGDLQQIHQPRPLADAASGL
jgi:hypothetical protein